MSSLLKYIEPIPGLKFLTHQVYPDIVLIKTPNQLKFDRCYIKEMEDKNTEELQLLKGPKTAPVPQKYDINGKGQKVFYLTEESDGQYTSAYPELNDGWRVFEEGTKSFMLSKTREVNERHHKQSWLEKYGPMVSMGLIAGTVIIVTMLVFRHQQAIIKESSSKVAGALRSAVKNASEGGPPV